MTAPKSTNRPVRAGAGASGSRRLGREEVVDLEACFRGEQASAWCLLLPGYDPCRDDILAHWAEWKRAHPGAIPPEGFEWIDAPEQP